MSNKTMKESDIGHANTIGNMVRYYRGMKLSEKEERDCMDEQLITTYNRYGNVYMSVTTYKRLKSRLGKHTKRLIEKDNTINRYGPPPQDGYVITRINSKGDNKDEHKKN